MDGNEKKLWEEYKKTKNPDIKKELALKYLNLVRYIVEKISYNSVMFEKDDFVNIGVIGLLDAIDKFDITKNIKFTTYAYIRIYGTIIDYIRKIEWKPRSEKEKLAKIEEAYKKLSERGIYNPSDSQIADELNMSVKEYNEFINKITINQVVDFDEIYNIEEKRVGFDEELFYNIENEEKKSFIIDVLDKFLDKKEAETIIMYYFENLTLKEIADELNLTEARISQIRANALQKLREHIGNDKNII